MNKRKIDCLLIGDCFFDITIKLSALNSLNLGGTLETEKLTALPGGSGNIAVMIARLGGVAALCGVVGEDPLGWAYREDLTHNSVLPLLRKKIGKPTGLLLTVLSSNGERSFLIARGANDFLERDHIQEAFETYDPNVVFMSGFSLNNSSMEPNLLAAIKYAQQINSKILFDCTPFNLIEQKRSLFESIVNRSHCTCLNYQEACSLVGATDFQAVIDSLKGKGCSFALKLGSKGCVIVTKNRVKRISGQKVRVKDTSGAGDCFAAAFALGISRKFSDRRMGEMGVRLGGLKVQYNGPRLPAQVRPYLLKHGVNIIAR